MTLNNIVLIVKQDIIRQVISDIVPDMVRSIVREEVSSVRDEVTILREVVSSLRHEVPILREAVTDLREEVRSELQSFYERISTLIERSSAHPTLAPAPVPGPPPPPSHSLPPQAEKEADVATTGPSDDVTPTAADTPAPAADSLTDMVYLF